MTKIRIEQLVLEEKEKIIEHIKKHVVTQEEVEYLSTNIITYKNSYKGRIMFLGRVGKRILAVIVAKEDNKYHIITARDAGKKERKLLYEKEKRQNT